MIAECTRLLTKPLASYVQRVPNNIDKLKKTLRKGDVLLVEGDQRVSQVIRYLTQSCWSHSALYVGDELLKGDPQRAADLRRRFGDEALHMLIEAEVGQGVCATPLAKYQRHNIRVCRAQGLVREDVDAVIGHVIGHLGQRYNVRHIVELARFFFPVSIVPRRWRRAALTFGSTNGRAVICSAMIADAFTRIGYPILPEVTLSDGPASSRKWWRRVVPHGSPRPLAKFRQHNPALVTPRDFDLSPYFEVVKFNHLGDPRLNYREIVWDHTPEPAPALSGSNGHSAAAPASSATHPHAPQPRLRFALGGAWALLAGITRR